MIIPAGCLASTISKDLTCTRYQFKNLKTEYCSFTSTEFTFLAVDSVILFDFNPQIHVGELDLVPSRWSKHGSVL